MTLYLNNPASHLNDNLSTLSRGISRTPVITRALEIMRKISQNRISTQANSLIGTEEIVQMPCWLFSTLYTTT